MKPNPRNVIDTVPMLRWGVAFGLGAVACDIAVARTWFLSLCFLVGLGLLLHRSRHRLCGVVVVLAVFAAGGTRMSVSERERDLPSFLFEHGYVDVSAVIVKEPVRYGRVLFTEAVLYGRDTPLALRGRHVVLSVMRDPAGYGERVLHVGRGIRGSVRLERTRQSSYDRWLRTGGIAARAFVPLGKWRPQTCSMSSLGWWERLRLACAVWREDVVRRMRQSGMGGDEFDIAVAMSLGYKATLSREVRDDFRVTGASHILAVSGTHIAIVFFLLRLVFGVPRRYLLPMVWAYVLVVGAPMSALRAVLMVTLWEVSRLLLREQKALNIFGAAFLLMTAVDVQCLWDVGFQMSFAAVLSILLLVGIVNRYMPLFMRRHASRGGSLRDVAWRATRRVLWYCWGVAGISLAAQIGTMPLTAHYFHTVSVVALLVSLVVVPAATVVIPLTLLAALATLSGWASCAAVLWTLLRWVMSAVYGVVSDVAAMPLSHFSDVELSVPRMVALYVATGAVAYIVMHRNRRRDTAPLLSPLPF